MCVPGKRPRTCVRECIARCPQLVPFGLDPDGDDGVQERLTGRLDSGEEEADYKYKVIWVICSTTKRPERVHMGDLWSSRLYSYRIVVSAVSRRESRASRSGPGLEK